MKSQNEDGSFGPRRDAGAGRRPAGERRASWIDPFCAWVLWQAGEDRAECRKAAAKGLKLAAEAALNPGEGGHGGPYLDV